MFAHAPYKTPAFERILHSLHPGLGMLGLIQSKIQLGKTAHLAKYHHLIGFGNSHNFIPRTIRDIQNQDPGENHWDKREEIIASLKQIGEEFFIIHQICESEDLSQEALMQRAQELLRYLEILQMRCKKP